MDKVPAVNAPSPEYLVFVCPDGRDVGLSAKVAVARRHGVAPDKVQVHKVYGADQALARPSRIVHKWVWRAIRFALGNWTTLKGVVIVGHLFCGANPGPAEMHWEQLAEAQDVFAPALAENGLTCETMLLHYTDDPESPGVILLDRFYEIVLGCPRDSYYGWEPQFEGEDPPV